jgi:Smg protein
MKENILDVLMYLFENYMDREPEILPDQDSLKVELVHAGFSNSEVDKAFDWLDGLASLKGRALESGFPARHSLRVYTDQESKKLGRECRGFLMYLEQIGVLDPSNRELVIDRVMALDGDEIDLPQLKLIILMALFNQPGQEAAFAWIEDQVFEEVKSVLH